MGSKKRKTTKSKSLASIKAQVASAQSSGSASPSTPSSPAPLTSTGVKESSTTITPVLIENKATIAQLSEEPTSLLVHNDNINDVNENDNDNVNEEQQPLLQSHEQLHSRNPHRTPTLPYQAEQNTAHSHSNSDSHSHEHTQSNGHIHAPQSIVDSQSIIHTVPKSSTPLKQTLSNSYGTNQSSVVVDISDSNSENSSLDRPLSPPPIVCKGVLITSEATKNKRKLIFVTVLCLVFFVVELIGGYFARSLALMSDAFHLLSDVVSFVISLIAIWLSEQPATKRHSFGYHRAEVLAALMSVFIIWILTAFLLMEAVERIRNPQPIDGKTMCVVASIGVGINIIHNDNGKAATRKKEVNINVKAATLHVIGDLISSAGVLLASIIIMVKPTWTIVDPICTLFFSVLVLFTTYRLVWDSLGILMEGTPTHIDPEELESSLLEIPGVTLVHDLHVWNLTAGKPSMAVHLQLAPTSHLTNQELTMADYDRILVQAQNVVCGRFQIHHSTIQLETASNSSDHCRPDICSNEPISASGVRGQNAV
ncbi:hypothetical protein BGZ76_001455 [Entomortierella beljakovae]|nr:hypothetical protein BGZ76_001455 [Entomortierella beljakovae]